MLTKAWMPLWLTTGIAHQSGIVHQRSLLGTRHLMRAALSCVLALAVVSVSGRCLAAESEDETESADSAEDVNASPDVQSQVGVGTEKAETTEEPEETTDEQDTAPGESAKNEDLGHMLQFGLRAGIVVPYKVAFRFDDSPSCDAPAQTAGTATEDKKVCGYGAPPQLDLALSFALLDSIEPFIWMRYGLGQDKRSNTAAFQLFGAGLRIYTMSDEGFKLFFQAAGGIETEGAANANVTPNANYQTDLLLHLNFGGQYDFNRYVGVYFGLGPNVSFRRAITTQLAVNGGLQFRGP